MTSRKCLVWLPHSYVGRGPAESCVRIIEHFPGSAFDTSLFVARSRKRVPIAGKVVEAAPAFARYLPYRLIEQASLRRLANLFSEAIDEAPPGSIAWFWPGVPEWLVLQARKRGLVSVREMINSPLAHARPILDAAYHAAGLQPAHGITEEAAPAETRELALHDFIFASNPEVEAALLALGVERTKILSTTFGWAGERFAGHAAPVSRPDRPLRYCFAGLLNVRKGVPILLEAWQDAAIDGEMWLAGAVEPSLRELVDRHVARGNVRHFGHVKDIGKFYAECDAFVFPTHEEGGPQVTYEAASCGLPVVTTPMGAARLVADGQTGLIVPPGDVHALARAMSALAHDGDLRARLSAAGAKMAAQFRYDQVGRQRLHLLESCAQGRVSAVA